jgi:hypothetical protein
MAEAAASPPGNQDSGATFSRLLYIYTNMCVCVYIGGESGWDVQLKTSRVISPAGRKTKNDEIKKKKTKEKKRK